MIITDKNRMDFANAKRFFSGLSFTDIISSVNGGYFRSATIGHKIDADTMTVIFRSLTLTLHNAENAEIDSKVTVYDDDGNCLGFYDFDLQAESLPESIAEYLNGETDNISNVEIVLKMIADKHKDKLIDYVTDEMLHDLLQKRNIQTIECLQIDDIPEEMKETIGKDYQEEHAEEIAKDWMYDNEDDVLDYIKENVNDSSICIFVKSWLDSIC